MNFEEETRLFRVAINREEQYSIWSDDKAIPDCWHEAGKSGDRQSSMEYINKMWTDIRPLSLRMQTAAQGGE